MYTEKQVKNAKCPLIFKDKDNECIGSDCTLWRWLNPEDYVESHKDSLGYCGLGGIPK
jgi:hypothetical protein